MTNSIEVHPVRRDMRFGFDQVKIDRWHSDSVHKSNFLNALSVFFPEGEQFFIDSIRHYRDKGAITDEKLLEDVRAFIGQEAMHGREHRDYNAALEAAGLDAESMDAFIGKLLVQLRKVFTPAHQLAGTCALEHLTASMANQILQNPELLADAEQVMADLWRWHALEETEHKGVAYDVYETAVGTGTEAYVIRVSAMVIAMAIFWPLAASFWGHMNYRSGRLFDVKGWRGAFKMLFKKDGGVLTAFGSDLRDYFRRDFHPWDHDNRAELELMPELEKAYAAA